MRNRLTIATAALLLASASLAAAQPATAPKPGPEPTPTTPWTGAVDFGFRINDATGDEARLERYRDLRNGVSSDIVLGKESDQSRMDFTARNIGYRDQRYTGSYIGGKANVSGMFDSIPLNYSYLTLTPYTVDDNGVLTLDAATRALVQAKKAVGVPCAPGAPPASCANPTQAAQALANRSIWNNFAQPFDIQQLRNILNLNAAYNPTADTTVNFSVTSTKKDGHMPWGASFAFNNAVEIPKPLNERTNDFSTGFEFVRPEGMFRVSWDGSWYNNQIHDIAWDNPIRASDFNNGKVPPNGPYDPSGYSNGNGPAFGRFAASPDNSQQVISALWMYKMPRRTVVSGQVAFIDQKQNDTLIPWTSNAQINQPLVWAAFPGLTALPRNTAEAEVKALNSLLTFNSRPWRNLGLNVRYRSYWHDNQTEPFDAIEYVRFDAVPEETGGISEGFDITRNTLDATATVTMHGRSSLRLGYSYDAFDRSGRVFSDTTENTFRASYDMFSSALLTLRAQYENGQRRGHGFHEGSLEEGGAQPGLRYYDEADRNRNRGIVMAILTPTDKLDVNFSFSGYKDEYKGPGHEFGLLNASVQSYNAGVNYTPRNEVAFGANYGWEKWGSFQVSRNANPDCTIQPPCPPNGYNSWLDPNRDWNLDSADKVNNFNLYLDLIKLVKKTDVRVSWDYEKSDQNFTHGGPRIQEFLTNSAFTAGDTAPCPAGVSSCFEMLPDVTNNWNRLTFDVRYFLSAKVGVAFAYWYEKFDVVDFATIDDAGAAGGPVPYVGNIGTPRIDYLGALMTGYGNRPYTGNTGFIRLLYTF
jgi:Putative outer membrane beta-barrel porin, MtrB/PioB